MRRITFYDDTYNPEAEEDEREFLFEEYGEEQGWKTKDDVPEEWIYNGLSDIQQEDFEMFMDAIKKVLEKKYLIAVGTAGLWYGRVAGGEFIENYRDFEDLVSGYDNLEIFEENGHLYINGYHHDGTNSFEVKYLTDKGAEFAENNDWAHDRELHETIFKYNLFSGTPKIAKVMGW